MRLKSIPILAFAVYVAMMLTAPAGLAQSNLSGVSVGITPDSPLHFLQNAIDQVGLALTFDNTAKAKKALEIAQERLLEARQMILENKLDAAQVAQREHLDALSAASTAAGSIQKSNKTDELGDEIDVQRALEEHDGDVAKVASEIGNKTANLPADQQALIDSILAAIGNGTAKVKIDIEDNKARIKVEIMHRENKTENETDDIESELEDQHGLTIVQKEKASEAVADATEKLAEVNSKIDQAGNSSVANSVTELVGEAQAHLSNATLALNQTDYGQAFGQANSALRILENAERQLEQGHERESEGETANQTTEQHAPENESVGPGENRSESENRSH